MLASAPAQSRTASRDGRSVAAKSLGESVESLEGVEPSPASFVAKLPDPPAETLGSVWVAIAGAWRRAAESNRVRAVLQTVLIARSTRRGCARPELNRAILSGTQACCRNISGAWCERRVESLGNAPSRSACKAEQQPSASDPVAGSRGIEPRSTDLESALQPLPEPERLVWVSIPSPPLDRRMSTPADSRGRRQFARRLWRHLFHAMRGRGRPDEPGFCALSARVERASHLLRRQRARAAGESVGDVRVSIPSRMHSQCTGFASSLTSQSERWESNPPDVLIPNQAALLEPALREWFRSESNRRLSLFRRALSPGQLPNREVTRRGYDPRLPG